MTLYVIIEAVALTDEDGSIKQTRRGWLKAETQRQAKDLKAVYEKLGTAEIVTSVSDLPFDANEVEGIPV